MEEERRDVDVSFGWNCGNGVRDIEETEKRRKAWL